MKKILDVLVGKRFIIAGTIIVTVGIAGGTMAYIQRNNLCLNEKSGSVVSQDKCTNVSLENKNPNETIKDTDEKTGVLDKINSLVRTSTNVKRSENVQKANNENKTEKNKDENKAEPINSISRVEVTASNDTKEAYTDKEDNSGEKTESLSNTPIDEKDNNTNNEEKNRWEELGMTFDEYSSENIHCSRCGIDYTYEMADTGFLHSSCYADDPTMVEMAKQSARNFYPGEFQHSVDYYTNYGIDYSLYGYDATPESIAISSLGANAEEYANWNTIRIILIVLGIRILE